MIDLIIKRGYLKCLYHLTITVLCLKMQRFYPRQSLLIVLIIILCFYLNSFKRSPEIKYSTKINVEPGLIVKSYSDLKAEIKSMQIIQPKSYQFPLNKCLNYKSYCLNLFKRLVNPNKTMIYNPPMKQIPEGMLSDFTQNGDLPLTSYWYFNDINADIAKNESIDQKQFELFRDKIKNSKPLGYFDGLDFSKVLHEYKNSIESKQVLVIQSETVWIEALLYEMNASKITTLNNTRRYWTDSKLEWHHVNDYLKKAIDAELIENFDSSITFSTVEHAGLGRFGDQLNPYGDVEAMKQIHCMTKSNGFLFLGDIRVNNQEKGSLKFNAHRIYGRKRLELLFEGWELIEEIKNKNIFKGSLFILKKIAC
jgi:hypothetical protein